MTLRLVPIVAVMMLAALPALADSALGGVDVVSLRDSGRPIPGNGDISTEWKGSAWIFANEANRAAFESNPRAYAPGFDGNCPVSLSEGRRRPGSPQFPVVVAGTLYLTMDGAAQGRLKADPDPILGRAAKAWARLR